MALHLVINTDRQPTPNPDHLLTSRMLQRIAITEVTDSIHTHTLCIKAA